MTYKDKEVQPEFFCPANKTAKSRLFGSTFFQKNYPASFTLTFDTLVVVLITGLMVNLACFVLGIERGKNIARNGSETHTVISSEDTPTAEPETIAAAIPSPEAAPSPVVAAAIPEPVTVAATEKGYVIQLVTYSSDASANEEIQRLKATGINGLVVKSGKYFVVCSGIYNSKTSAVQKLGNFKKRYKDCFVRFLERT
ncbi:MAG: SPOR domain-containing protein [Candidatus Omnitrophica bacterium]|nr:SPOR domain-containing protein [Candidatus Omnitrophota bacterium]